MNPGNPLEWSASKIITSIADVTAAMEIPCGATVGDVYGGRSFNDNIAAVLESRSHRGWQEIEVGEQRWTVIEIAK
jgi:hypothetical protein